MRKTFYSNLVPLRIAGVEMILVTMEHIHLIDYAKVLESAGEE
jgi:hypothetical protein